MEVRLPTLCALPLANPHFHHTHTPHTPFEAYNKNRNTITQEYTKPHSPPPPPPLIPPPSSDFVSALLLPLTCRRLFCQNFMRACESLNKTSEVQSMSDRMKRHVGHLAAYVRHCKE
jgi:hypothetical protein